VHSFWLLFITGCSGSKLPDPTPLSGAPLPCRGDGSLIALADDGGLWTSCVGADAPDAGAIARLDVAGGQTRVVALPAEHPLGHVVAVARDGDALEVVWRVRDGADLAAARVEGSAITAVHRITGNPEVLGAWLRDGVPEVVVRTADGGVRVAPNGPAIACGGGRPVAVWHDGAATRVLANDGARTVVCTDGGEPVEVVGRGDLTGLDRSVAGVLPLIDAGRARWRLHTDGTIAETAGGDLPAFHRWEGVQLRRVERTLAPGGVTRFDDPPLRVSLDGDLALRVNDRPVVSAAHAPVDLTGAVPLPGEPLRLVTTTGLWFPAAPAE